MEGRRKGGEERREGARKEIVSRRGARKERGGKGKMNESLVLQVGY